jgi:hypothetical protein
VKIGDQKSKRLTIECNSPVTFEYVIEWVKEHPDMKLTPMRGDILGNSTVELELLYTPNESATAQASFKLITTEFDSKPQEVKIIGSAVKA